MTKGKNPKRYDLSTAFMQSLVDQDSERTVKILTHSTDSDLRGLIRSQMAVAQMLLTFAVKRGMDISDEAAIVVELPGGEEGH